MSVLEKLQGKYLVLGASGFIGRNIYEYLQSLNLNVYGTYHTNSFSQGIPVDLESYYQINQILKEFQFDYVFMCNAKTYGIGITSKTPEEMVRANIVMNANVLDACYKNKVKKVVFISSSTVYQDSNKVLEEDMLDLNKDPFPLYQGVGWVKRYTEILCKFYNSLGLNTVVVRPTNIYGKYDSFQEGISHFIPAVVKRALEKQVPFKVWGSGKVVKDFIHIEDFIRDLFEVFIYHNSSDPINICSGKVYSVKESVEIILRACNHNSEPEYDLTKLDSVPCRILSKKKFIKLFGKKSYIPLETGIIDVKNWIEAEL